MSGIARKQSVLICRRLPKEAFEIIRKSNFDLDYWDDDEEIPRNKFLEKVVGKDGVLLTLMSAVDETVVQRAGERLKVISTVSVGYDHIKPALLKERGIRLGNTPDVLTDATAELTVALLLATARGLLHSAEKLKRGEIGSWSFFVNCGRGLLNSTVGIVGFGRIGQQVGARLKPFGIKALLYNSPREMKNNLRAEWVPDLQSLLPRCDFVICTCALNEATRGLFDERAFRAMKPTAIFVNSSRGPVVNQEHLVDALRNNIIGGAGLDVTTPEPLPPDHPLLHLPNCVVLPHIGSAVFETRIAMCCLAAENLVAGVLGKEMPAEVKL